jgi:hypothetical protein
LLGNKNKKEEGKPSFFISSLIAQYIYFNLMSWRMLLVKVLYKRADKAKEENKK